MSLVLEERITGIFGCFVTDAYKNCASESVVPGQPGAKYQNIKLYFYNLFKNNMEIKIRLISHLEVIPLVACSSF